MAGLTNYAENLLLDWLLTTGSATRPTTWYVALHTGDPGEDADANEVVVGTDANYARQAVTFGAAANGQALSAAQVAWTAASDATTYTITHISIHDALTAGNPLFKGELLVQETMNADDVFAIAIGDLVAALD